MLYKFFAKSKVWDSLFLFFVAPVLLFVGLQQVGVNFFNFALIFSVAIGITGTLLIMMFIYGIMRLIEKRKNTVRN